MGAPRALSHLGSLCARDQDLPICGPENIVATEVGAPGRPARTLLPCPSLYPGTYQLTDCSGEQREHHTGSEASQTGGKSLFFSRRVINGLGT